MGYILSYFQSSIDNVYIFQIEHVELFLKITYKKEQYFDTFFIQLKFPKNSTLYSLVYFQIRTVY